MCAQRKDITCHRVKREVLIQAADHRVLGVEHNLVIEHIGNRAPIGQRDEICPAPRPETAVNGVIM